MINKNSNFEIWIGIRNVIENFKTLVLAKDLSIRALLTPRLSEGTQEPHLLRGIF